MKKFLAVLAIAGTLVACNDSASSTEAKQDSIDSATNASKDMIDSSADARKDKLDSTAEMKKDALDRVDSLNHSDSTVKH